MHISLIIVRLVILGFYSWKKFVDYIHILLFIIQIFILCCPLLLKTFILG